MIAPGSSHGLARLCPPDRLADVRLTRVPRPDYHPGPVAAAPRQPFSHAVWHGWHRHEDPCRRANNDHPRRRNARTTSKFSAWLEAPNWPFCVTRPPRESNRPAGHSRRFAHCRPHNVVTLRYRAGHRVVRAVRMRPGPSRVPGPAGQGGHLAVARGVRGCGSVWYSLSHDPGP